MRKNYFLVFLLFIGITTTLNAQSWSQVGSDIDGAAGDKSGSAVSISADGTVIAIGAINYNSLDGRVRIYKNNSGIWTKVGSDINAEATQDRVGYSVDLNDNGSIVAVGAPWNNGNGDNSGHVRIFQNNSGIWTQVGADINGEAADDRSGSSVSLSSDGSVIAIGARMNDGNGNYAGHVRVFQNISGTWTQIGADIDGEAADDYSGRSVSLSSDGSVVAIDGYLNDPSGHVRIYQNIEGTWTQIGSDIDGEGENDSSGFSIDLNSDGTVVAIGAIANDGNGSNSGHVRIYQNVSDVWTQVGEDIDGEAELDCSGVSVSISSDGSIVAIGAGYNDGNGTDAGHVRIFKNITETWTQIGLDIDGEEAGDYFGGSQYNSTNSSVSLSSDGTVVAIGAPVNDGNGTDAGQVRVFEVQEPNIINQPNDQTDVCPGDEANFSVIAENATYYQWQVSANGGVDWGDIEETEIYSGSTTNSLTLTTDNSLNNNMYHCLVGTNEIVSNAATLTYETENPTITCVSNQERDKNSTGTYTVAGTEFDPSEVDDNCEVEGVINDFNNTSSLAGASLPAGITTIKWTATDVAGNEAEYSFDVTVEDATGITNLAEAGISIYPNPTKGIVKVDFAENNVQKLKVSDITGKIVFESTNLQQSENIDLSAYANGIYIIMIETEEGNYSSKIIKE